MRTDWDNSTIVKRNTTFMGTIFLGAFATEMYGGPTSVVVEE